MDERQPKLYDAVIIGTGQAGKPLAGKLSKEGWNVAVIEKEHSGGSCINYGCTPTKIMLASAQVAWMVKNSYSWGLNVSGDAVDFDQVIQRRDNIVEKFRNGIDESLKENKKVDVYRGTGSFISEKRIRVQYNDPDKEEDVLEAGKIFIDTGTEAEVPKIKGIKEVPYYTPRTWMNIQKIPEHLAIVGGGNIGVEFAQMFSRLGSKVTIFQNMEQLLPREDEDVASALLEVFRNEGIDIHLNAMVEGVSLSGEHNIQIRFSENGMKATSNASEILVATGTTAATHELHLSKAGIDHDEKGYIRVNEYLETSTENIFALGDCKGGAEFTHVAYDDYRVVSDYLFGERKRKAEGRLIPYTLFTDPQLGRIGLNEKQCKKQGISFRKAIMKAEDIARGKETNQTRGFIKVLVGDDDKILGASVLLSEGGELASLLQVAMMGNLPYQALRDSMFAHPTWAECLNNVFNKGMEG